MSYYFVQTFHFLSLFPSSQCISRQPRPRALFPGLGSGHGVPTSKARKKRAEDEVNFSHSTQYGMND